MFFWWNKPKQQTTPTISPEVDWVRDGLATVFYRGRIYTLYREDGSNDWLLHHHHQGIVQRVHTGGVRSLLASLT